MWPKLIVAVARKTSRVSGSMSAVSIVTSCELKLLNSVKK